MNDDRETEVFECEAASFLMLGKLLRNAPKKGWVDALVEDRLFFDLPYAAGRTETVRGQAYLIEWARGYDDAAFDAMSGDYMSLFVGPGKPLVPPWESTFGADSEGLVFQRDTLEVRKAYRHFGLQIDALHHEPDDHIGYELEFLAYLSQLVADARMKGKHDEAEHALLAQADFLEKHLLSWAFNWCEAIQAHASTDFYRGVSLLVTGFLKEAATARLA